MCNASLLLPQDFSIPLVSWWHELSMMRSALSIPNASIPHLESSLYFTNSLTERSGKEVYAVATHGRVHQVYSSSEPLLPVQQDFVAAHCQYTCTHEAMNVPGSDHAVRP